VKFLLDTCAISELTKPAPHPGVVSWFAQQDELALYLAAPSVGELKRGVEKLEDGKRKRFLRNWLAESVIERFGARILPADTDIFLRWGEMQAQLESRGKPMPPLDGLIAATALHHQLTVVTRNTRDMEASGASLFNPWDVTT
jgi:predicted nucleic acid-binding protein